MNESRKRPTQMTLIRCFNNTSEKTYIEVYSNCYGNECSCDDLCPHCCAPSFSLCWYSHLRHSSGVMLKKKKTDFAEMPQRKSSAKTQEKKCFHKSFATAIHIFHTAAIRTFFYFLKNKNKFWVF